MAWGNVAITAVASNAFPLSRCLGIVMPTTIGFLDADSIALPESAVLWASTAALVLTVWFEDIWTRSIGALMISGYLAFILVDYVVVHR